MAWYKNQSGPVAVSFTNVSPRPEYVPSWLAPKTTQGGPLGMEIASLGGAQVPPVLGVPQVLTSPLDSAPPCGPGTGVACRTGSDAATPSPAIDGSLRPERLALEEARHQTMLLNDELTKAIRELSRTREQMLDDAIGQVLELGVLIAQRVVAQEVESHPEILEKLIREALNALASRSPLRVRVGPGFAPAAAVASEALASQGATVEVSPDPTLDRFGCIVQTDLGSVDEGIARRLQTLVEGLKQENGA